MRNPNRIANFMYELGEIWGQNLPDWRFGQLMVNFISEVGDPFYLEEDDFLEKFKKYVQNVKARDGY